MIHDWVYENRAIYLTELTKVGGQVQLLDPHRVMITGPTRVAGRRGHVPAGAAARASSSCSRCWPRPARRCCATSTSSTAATRTSPSGSTPSARRSRSSATSERGQFQLAGAPWRVTDLHGGGGGDARGGGRAPSPVSRSAGVVSPPVRKTAHLRCRCTRRRPGSRQPWWREQRRCRREHPVLPDVELDRRPEATPRSTVTSQRGTRSARLEAS